MRLYKKGTQMENSRIRIFIFVMIAMAALVGCTGKGDLRFQQDPEGMNFNISGKIVLPEIVENDLLSSIRANLAALTNFSDFIISNEGITTRAGSDGSFSLKKAPFSDNFMLKAEAGKIILLRYLSADELYYTDLSSTEISIKTTALAMIRKQGIELGKKLTVADMSAREYETIINDLITTIKLTLQLPDESVSTNVLEIPAVINAARSAASVIEARETVLKDANSVFQHIFIRKDLQMLQVYISSAFSNDWDSTSNWSDLTAWFAELFNTKEFSNVEWRVVDMEFLPENRARVRTEYRVTLTDINSAEKINTEKFVFDALWRKEGTFWKLYRNFPYREGHPTQVGADVRWGQIADTHRLLQAALGRESMTEFEQHISPAFGNDFDVTSTRADLLSTAKARFNAMDVKIATYSIERIDFYAADMAKVRCAAQVRVINLLPGKDVDSGVIKAEVHWRREEGEWKVFRNLPYRFTHPLTR